MRALAAAVSILYIEISVMNKCVDGWGSGGFEASCHQKFEAIGLDQALKDPKFNFCEKLKSEFKVPRSYRGGSSHMPRPKHP